MSLFAELKQRNVFRVAITYVLASWVLLQIADVVLGNIAAPDWVFKSLLLLLGLGFPFVLIFAWAFELTPDGLKREKEVDRSQSITTETGRKLNVIVICLLVTLVAILLADRFLFKDSVEISSVAAVESVDAKTKAAANPSVPKVTAKLVANSMGQNSIAVLPFVNMSSDPEQDYFSDGISEELLNLLAKIPDFRVAGRTSSFAFKGKNEDLRQIGESLGVANILEGSVRKGGDRVRITAQLVKVDDGFHLWSETYDRELHDIFEVQDDIAGAVVSELKLTLLGHALDAQADPLMQDPAAYDAYLKGLAFMNLGGPENSAKAAIQYEEAVRLESQSALAWAGLAKAQIWFAAQGADDIAAAKTDGRIAVDRALALNDQLPEAYMAKALQQYMFDWDWQGAMRSIDQALQLRPADTQARIVKSDILEILGHLDDAQQIIDEAESLDPRNDNVIRKKVGILQTAGRYREAETQRLNIIAKNSGVALPFDNSSLGRAVFDQGRFDDALTYFQAEPVGFARLTGLATVYHKLGRFDEAKAAQQELLETYGDAASYQQAAIYAEWGATDKALAWLRKAYEVRDPGMNSLLTDNSFDTIRGNPEFKDMLRKLGLAD